MTVDSSIAWLLESEQENDQIAQAQPRRRQVLSLLPFDARKDRNPKQHPRTVPTWQQLWEAEGEWRYAVSRAIYIIARRRGIAVPQARRMRTWSLDRLYQCAGITADEITQCLTEQGHTVCVRNVADEFQSHSEDSVLSHLTGHSNGL